MSGCHAPCDTDSNNSFFDGNEEMGGSIPSHATDTDFRIKTEYGEVAER